MLKRFFAALALSLLLISPAHAVRPLPKPQLLAVYFYADWCPNCKILSVQLDDARLDGMLDQKGVLFVKLNLTDKASIHQSILLASQLGIADFVQAQGSKTGYIALLDAATGKELTRFDRNSMAGDIRKGIEERFAPKSE